MIEKIRSSTAWGFLWFSLEDCVFDSPWFSALFKCFSCVFSGIVGHWHGRVYKSCCNHRTTTVDAATFRSFEKRRVKERTRLAMGKQSRGISFHFAFWESNTIKPHMPQVLCHVSGRKLRQLFSTRWACSCSPVMGFPDCAFQLAEVKRLLLQSRFLVQLENDRATNLNWYRMFEESGHLPWFWEGALLFGTAGEADPVRHPTHGKSQPTFSFQTETHQTFD